jgi:hypothetical protein
MIVRGALTDGFHLILDRIKSLDELGELDMKWVEEWWPKGKKPIADPNTAVVPRGPEGQAKVFAFWLPHGLGPDYDIHEVCRKFHKDFAMVENLLFGYFKLPIRADLPPEKVPCSYLDRKVE